MKALLLSLVFSSLLACKKDGASPTQSFDLAYQRPTTIVAGGTVQATLTTINDSRCPSDVVCISAGTISLTVTLTDAATSQTARLGYDRNYARDSAQLTLNNQVYWLRLLDVKPYPSTKNGNQTKVATLRLRPQ